jgi:hypothetical protein
LLFGAHLSVQSFWDELFTRDLSIKRDSSPAKSGGNKV